MGWLVLPPVLFHDKNKIKWSNGGGCPWEVQMVHLMTAFAADRWALLKSISHLFSKAEIYLPSGGWLATPVFGSLRWEIHDPPCLFVSPALTVKSSVPCTCLQSYSSFSDNYHVIIPLPVATQSSRFCGYRQSWPCQWSVSVTERQ